MNKNFYPYIISLALCFTMLGYLLFLNKKAHEAKLLNEIFPNYDNLDNRNFEYFINRDSLDLFLKIRNNFADMENSRFFYDKFYHKNDSQNIVKLHSSNVKFMNFILKSLFIYEVTIYDWDYSEDKNILSINFRIHNDSNANFLLFIKKQNDKYFLYDFKYISYFFDILYNAIYFEKTNSLYY